MLLITTVVLAREPIHYEYRLPDGAGPAAAVATTYTTKDEVFAANDEAKLRAEGSPDAKLLWQLPVGAPVTVLAAGNAGANGEFGGAWLPVQAGDRTGWMHTSDLTPYAWKADFDLDGDVEVATVAFLSDFTIRVTVYEPDMRVANISVVDLDSAGGAYVSQKGGVVRADLLPANKAGLPLIHVWTGVEACADFADYWVSYTSNGKAKPGMAAIALTQGGLMDPPSCSTYAVKFDAKRHLAVVTTSQGDCGTSKAKPTLDTSRWVLVDGVYKVERPGGVVR